MVLQDESQFLQKIIKVFGSEVGTLRMLLGEVIGVLPLVDEVVSIGVVHSPVVVVDSLADFEIAKADASGQSSQIVNSNVISPEEVQNLLALRIRNVEDLLLLNARIV